LLLLIAGFSLRGMSAARNRMKAVKVVFFDIGDTLAVARPGSPLELDPLPGAADVLRRLSVAGLRLGIISNTGSETVETMRRALVGAGLYEFFEPQLLIYSSVVQLKKDSPEIFKLSCGRAGFGNEPQRCMFVGESPAERSFAAQAGLRVAESPTKAVTALMGEGD
jgi:bacterial leucyl aminopeptidase